MSDNDLMQGVVDGHKRAEPLAPFAVGDTVDVHTRIREGDKERVQVFTGTVLRKNKNPQDVTATFTVRRIVDGQGVERIFPVHSPRVVAVKVVRQGRVRRAKLYYLRDRIGKATKVKEDVLAGIAARKIAREQKAAARKQPQTEPVAAEPEPAETGPETDADTPAAGE